MSHVALYVGWSAVAVGGLSSFPQLFKVIMTRSVEDISPLFIILRICSEILYAIYGYLVSDFVMIASTSLPLVSDGAQFVLYLKFTSHHRTRACRNVKCTEEEGCT